MASGDWKIRGEGNSSLVVTDNEKRMVYRITKKKNGEKKDPQRSRHKLEMNQDFIKTIMAPLLNHHYVPLGKLVELTNAQLEHISQAVQMQRAAHRLDQGVDGDCPVTMTLPDLCYIVEPLVECDLPTFSVEIKPKRGFLHPSVNEQTWPQAAVCRFCMHQQLKRKQGKWRTISKYCPLDLFSGVPERMQRAFRNLLQTPQNNLRISRDGELVWGEGINLNLADDMKQYFPTSNKLSSPRHNKGLDPKMTEISAMGGFFEVLEQCLLATSEPQENVHTTTAHNPQVCAGVNFRGRGNQQGLPKGCVLDRVLQVQKLAGIQIEKMSTYAERLQKHLASHPEDSQRMFGLDGPYDLWLTQEQSADDGSVEHAIQKIKEFVVSATAFDCSIMVAVQPLPRDSDLPVDIRSGRGIMRWCGGNLYQYSVSVVDLDPKAWQKIPRYCKKEKEIKSFYTKVTTTQ